MRSKLGENVKASHYAKVLRVVKRLNLIEPSLKPAEVKLALEDFKRDIDPFMNMPTPATVDNFGRAVGVGKRKESTARAWVVEGTGEVQINGKSLSQAFGRVHDRESAIWALQATERLDKYNVWALVEGGGTTGQAEAMTLAVAKALIAHEPALKTALRKGILDHHCPLCSRTNANLFLFSRLYHERCQNGGEEEARTRQGAKDACLGQAINCQYLSDVLLSSVTSQFSHRCSEVMVNELKLVSISPVCITSLSVVLETFGRIDAWNQQCARSRTCLN